MEVRRCENCTLEHDGSYGDGRFCKKGCAKSFSTKNNRSEISKKISATLRKRGIHPVEKYQFKAGHKHPSDGRKEEWRKRNSDLRKAFWRRKSANELILWKDGKLVPSHDVAKRLLIYEHGEKCAICGWCEINAYSNTVPVELEHKDGDCYNSSYENVCLLCPNHHSLTPTFRGLNVGKGRGRKFYKLVSQWAKEQQVKGIWSSAK
jgi:hypothetical protein